MKNKCYDVIPHTHLVDNLFALEKAVSRVFQDVLGLHNIDHLAIAEVNEEHILRIFSSTPAMEYNLFTSDLWRFDNTYKPEWFHQGTLRSWQSLYALSHYQDLYFTKQIKHHFPIGFSFAIKKANAYYISSFASTNASQTVDEFFQNHREDLDKISQYCINQLTPFFIHW